MTKKIALIDDSKPFCLLVNQLLELEDYKVDTYHIAEQFLRIPSKIASYDLIIMDINLPDMDGLTALNQLKSNPITAKVKVLLLSGDSSSENVNAGIQLGASDFLTKPIEPERWIERVNLLLQD